MSTLLAPLPDHDPLTVREVAAAYGVDPEIIQRHLRKGRFPNAFRTPTEQRGHWRIPRADAVAVGKELGVIR